MNSNKVTQEIKRINNDSISDYNHYIGLDWSLSIMAIAHMNQKSKDPKVHERPSNIKELKDYLVSLKGRKILALEETTTSQWLYLELVDSVDRILVCDPFRNRLLSDGPKTDKIDAGKLCMLLRAGLLKEVFHSSDVLYDLRILVSAYEDLLGSGVRIMNQQDALERGHFTTNEHAPFILEHTKKSIAMYRASKQEYKRKFEKIVTKHTLAKNQKEIPGIGVIGAVKVVATVVDAHRFPYTGKYWCYCGLAQNEKFSGGRRYGHRRPRFNRRLKSVYKTAAASCISGTTNPMKQYYDHLIEKGIGELNARNAVARYIAKVSYGMLKNGRRYNPNYGRGETSEHHDE
jgi:hypothetical protein